jgi:hypothetical protein
MRVLLVALITLVLAAALLAGTGYIQEKKARELSEEMVRSLYTEWDYRVVLDNAVDELVETEDDEKWARMFEWGRKGLGKLEHLGQPTGGVGVRWGPHAPSRGVYGHYEFKARFAEGPARLDIDLLWRGGRWRISGTRFNAEALLDAARKHGLPGEQEPRIPREDAPPVGSP